MDCKLFPSDVLEPPAGEGDRVVVKSFFGARNVEMVVTGFHGDFFFAALPLEVPLSDTHTD